MKIASVADVKAKLSEYVRASDSGPVVITRNGKAVAAIIGLADDDEVERLLLSYSPRLRAIFTDAKRRFRAGQGIPHDKFWRQIDSSAKKRKAS